jgi:O-antigen ligase
MTITYFSLVLAVFSIISYILYHFVKFSWLNKICTLLVISLPFERIPSLQIGGGNIRVSQILVFLGFWVMGVLYFKKDKSLSETKFNKLNYFLSLFLVFSIPSYFVATNVQRFWITEVGTLFVFGAFFLLSNFVEDVYCQARNLMATLIFVSLFGVYQFFGDLAGLPIYLTGLRETYTKIVFGIPRIQATAIEPLYFAGMLFFGLFFVIGHLMNQNHSLRYELQKKLLFSSGTTNVLIFILFCVVFLLTISKAAIIEMIILLPIFVYFIGLINGIDIYRKLKNFAGYFGIFLFVFVSYLSFNSTGNGVFQGIVGNFVTTISGESASAVERNAFLQGFNNLIENRAVFGIGSGQYGVLAPSTISVESNEGYLIVNNVYLEVWLEHGIVPVIIFISFLARVLYLLYKKTIQEIKTNVEVSTLSAIFGFTLIAYFIQWTTFSPIFIMPIFIILGLGARLVQD